MYDVIILGGGVVGASAACSLARRKQRVLMIERFEPAHDHGSSHGDGRMIRYDYSESVYIEMAARAYRAWDALAGRVGEPLLQKTGLCNFGPEDNPQLAELEQAMSAFGLPCERLSASQTNARFPHYRIDAGSETLYQGDGGVVFADRAVLALWRCAQEDGVETLTGARIRDMETRPDHVRLCDETGRSWEGGRLVLAAGGWSGPLLGHLGVNIPFEVTQEQLAYFPSGDGLDHRIGIMANCIDYHSEQPFYCLPQVRVPGVKVGWHHTGPVVDPDHPKSEDIARLASVQDFVRRRCPHLDPHPIKTVQCLYTNSPDYHFILDRVPGHPNIVAAAGFSGHGFKFGPVLGDMLAAKLLDEPPPVDMTMFSIDRFAHKDTLARRTTA